MLSSSNNIDNSCNRRKCRVPFKTKNSDSDDDSTKENKPPPTKIVGSSEEPYVIDDDDVLEEQKSKLKKPYKPPDQVAFAIPHPFQIDDSSKEDIFTKSSIGLRSEVLLSQQILPISSTTTASSTLYKVHDATIKGLQHDPKWWLNDEIVNLILQSLILTTGQSINPDEVLILDSVSHGSYFLQQGNSDRGIISLLKATLKYSEGLFNKKVIFVPLCDQTHWNLFLIVNPLATLLKSLREITGSSDDGTDNHFRNHNHHCQSNDGESFGLFLCSFNNSIGKIPIIVNEWLNREVQRLCTTLGFGKQSTLTLNGKEYILTTKQPFNSTTFQMVAPKKSTIPRQPPGNYCDCGLYVIYYAYCALLLLESNGWYCCRTGGGSRYDNCINNHNTCTKNPKRCGYDLLMKQLNESFSFTQNDISQLRYDLGITLGRVKQLYQQSKNMTKVDSSSTNQNPKTMIIDGDSTEQSEEVSIVDTKTIVANHKDMPSSSFKRKHSEVGANDDATSPSLLNRKAKKARTMSPTKQGTKQGTKCKFVFLVFCLFVCFIQKSKLIAFVSAFIRNQTSQSLSVMLGF